MFYAIVKEINKKLPFLFAALNFSIKNIQGHL